MKTSSSQGSIVLASHGHLSSEVLVQNQLGIYLTQVLEYMFNIAEINCSFLVQGFEAVNINIS